MKDTVEITCPYCGEPNEIYIDFSGGVHQSYVEDCQICCQPWEIFVDLTDEEPAVTVRASNE
ncbi:MAG: CPXCG motif-containing cysteine-rich protein [bacterium]